MRWTLLYHCGRGCPCQPRHFSLMIALRCRPQTHGEEELQLQLALAMSREEADAEDSKKKSDDMRLQMAIAKSKEDGSEDSAKKEVNDRDELCLILFSKSRLSL